MKITRNNLYVIIGVLLSVIIFTAFYYVESREQQTAISKNESQIMSEEKQIDKDSVMIPSNWLDVCTKDLTEYNGCLYDNRLEDSCSWIGTESASCTSTNYKPADLTICYDKYDAYKQKLWGEYDPVSIVGYAYHFCNLPDDPAALYDDCGVWWDRYQEISKNDLTKKSEKQFINQYCIPYSEPDWESWGCFSYPETDKEFCGPVTNFPRSMALKCQNEPCTFNHYNGINSTVKCPQASIGTYGHIITFNTTTKNYDCRLP